MMWCPKKLKNSEDHSEGVSFKWEIIQPEHQFLDIEGKIMYEILQ